MLQGGDFFSWILSPPGATIFVLILATLINLGTTILTRLLANPKELARKQATIKEHQDQKKSLEHLKEEDPTQYAKELVRWKRREKAIGKMQQSISLSRAKPSLINCISIVFFMAIINVFYAGIPVALPAMNPGSIPLLGDYIGAKALGGWINFYAWYFLCSLAMSTIIQRVLGTTQTFNWSNLLSGGKGINPAV
ncbi:MAG: hypothetical protein RBG13Loki_2902 [Promethearchaeota archaeon CR_4]|nr:MAG: hypothetical protein RBG13Loki_2902 [Candidatus Lokiarchaeota archaeon CR_4]